VLPLADVRVVAIEQFGAGPWGTLQLADLGAEVIKIEDPSSGGDVSRSASERRSTRPRSPQELRDEGVHESALHRQRPWQGKRPTSTVRPGAQAGGLASRSLREHGTPAHESDVRACAESRSQTPMPPQRYPARPTSVTAGVKGELALLA